MVYDNTCKYLAERYARDYATWVFKKVPESVEVMKTELSIEPIRADSVTFLRTEERILHLEFEVDPKEEPPVPLRMLDYWLRLYRRDRLPISQAVILLKETAAAKALVDFFQQENTYHRYQFIRMWEQDPATFLQNPALLPLASLCRTDTPDRLLDRVAEEVGKIDRRGQREEISACSQIIAGLRFEKPFIQQLFREDIMRESVIYQDILQKGVQQGLQQGQQQALVSSILDALSLRFDSVPPSVAPQLSELGADRLQSLNRQAWTCQTLDEFIAQLG